MNFIWDITLNAEKNGLDRKEIFFRQAQSSSPWYEQSFPALNQKTIEDTTVEINTLCRFDAIFHGILHPEMKAMPRFREYLIDLVIHFLCEMDLHQGLTKHEFYLRRLGKEIAGGVFAKESARDYELLPDELKNRLAALLFSQLKTGSSLFVFRRAVLVACPGAMLYQLREKPEQLLLYLGRKKTREYEHRTQFIINTFLPIHYQIRIFWEYHFGVLGVDATLHPDEMEVF